MKSMYFMQTKLHNKKPDPVVCPNCGAEFIANSDYAYCNKCGTQLPNKEASDAAPVPDSDNDAGWIVTEVRWIREIQVEEYRLVEESGWSTPEGAEQVTSRTEVRSYTQQAAGSHEETYYVDVYDHDEIVGYDQRETGTGGIELVPITERVYRKEARTRTVIDYVSVPVWDTRYYYKVWRWIPSRTASASGNDLNAVWPELDLAENEREASDNSRSEKYIITVKKGDDPLAVRFYRVNGSDWPKIKIGEPLDFSLESLENES